MAAFPRVLALGLLVLTMSLAGCNFKDFYNQNGTVRIEVVPQGPENSSLTDFRSLKLALFGVTTKQVLSAQPREFSFGESPLVIDFLDAGTKGDRILVAEYKQNLRAVEYVQLRLDIIEAVDAQGRDIPTCYEGVPVESFPCFLLPPQNVFRLKEPQFAPPRGGTVTMGFPLAVKSVSQEGNTEYFLVGDPSQATLDSKR